MSARPTADDDPCMGISGSGRVTRPRHDHPVWEPLDRVLAAATAALRRGDEDEAMRLFDASEYLETAILSAYLETPLKKEISNEFDG